MIRVIRTLGTNAFAFTLGIYFLGFLSLSFLGEDNKSVRITTTLLALFILLFRAANSDHFLFFKNKIIRLFFLYICALLPSLLFSDMIFMSAFKVLDIVIILLLINDSARSFIMKDLRITGFQLVLYYFVIQCIIIMAGYFLDPEALRQDFLEKGITFLSSNFPKIHSNTVGTFGGAVILYAVFRIRTVPQNALINFAILALGLSVVYLSSSRTGMLATLAGATFLIITTFSGKQQMYLLGCLFLVVLFFGLEIYQFGFKAFMKLQTQETLANADNTTDLLLSGRLGLWQIILDKPQDLIFGRGFGTALVSAHAMDNTNAHNSIVELMINAGVIAAVLWVLIWWKMLGYYRYIMRNKPFLPIHENYYHLSFALLILIFVKSMANITFVYFQLFDWLMVSIICLYINTEIKIKHNKQKLRNVHIAHDVYTAEA